MRSTSPPRLVSNAVNLLDFAATLPTTPLADDAPGIFQTGNNLSAIRGLHSHGGKPIKTCHVYNYNKAAPTTRTRDDVLTFASSASTPAVNALGSKTKASSTRGSASMVP